MVHFDGLFQAAAVYPQIGRLAVETHEFRGCSAEQFSVQGNFVGRQIFSACFTEMICHDFSTTLHR